MKSLLFLPLAFLLMAASPQSGTVKVHGTEVGNRNEPHVCTFHVHGTDITSGTWTITSWPPTGDKTVVASGSGPVSGDISLPNGHYRLDYENPGKHKMFWVECDADVQPTPVPSNAVNPVPIQIYDPVEIALPETDTVSDITSNTAAVLLGMFMVVLFAYLALSRARGKR